MTWSFLGTPLFVRRLLPSCQGLLPSGTICVKKRLRAGIADMLNVLTMTGMVNHELVIFQGAKRNTHS